MTGPAASRQIPHMTPAGQPTSGSDPPPQPGPILTERAGRHLHCQPQGPGAGESAHDHPGRGRRRHHPGHPAGLQARRPGDRVPGSHRPHPRPMNRQPNPRNSKNKIGRRGRRRCAKAPRDGYRPGGCMIGRRAGPLAPRSRACTQRRGRTGNETGSGDRTASCGVAQALRLSRGPPARAGGGARGRRGCRSPQSCRA